MTEAKSPVYDSPAFRARLPEYYRLLRQLLQQGVYRCSSKEIAAALSLSPTAVRSDLGRFSGCAKQGYGYHVKQLYTALSAYLGLGDEFRAVLVGNGSEAEHVRKHPLIAVRGIRLAGEWDPAHQKEGSDLPAFCTQMGAVLLLLLEPLPKEVLEQLASAGIRGIWNLSAVTLPPIPGILVKEVHPFDSLISLCCDLKQAQSGEDL